MLAERLAEQLLCLPARMRSAVTAACVSANAQDSVARLAAAVGVDQSTLARHFLHAGLCKPLRLVASARVVRAYPAQVARAVGVASAAALDRQLRALMGARLREMRAEAIDADRFIERVMRAVVRSA